MDPITVAMDAMLKALKGQVRDRLSWRKSMYMEKIEKYYGRRE